MNLNTVFIRTMAVEYESTRLRLMEMLEQMTTGSAFAPIFMQLADEQNARFARLVEIFRRFEERPDFPPTFDGTVVYPRFLEAMKRMSVMMKPDNLETLLKTLRSARHVYAFALHVEQAAAHLYEGIADALEHPGLADKIGELARQAATATARLENLTANAPTKQVTIKINRLPEQSPEDDSYEDIVV